MILSTINGSEDFPPGWGPNNGYFEFQPSPLREEGTPTPRMVTGIGTTALDDWLDSWVIPSVN